MADTHNIQLWQRFWAPRPLLATHDDAGFLVDPADGWRAAMGAGVVPLASLDASPILILLGEPGMGKSTEVAADAERLRAFGGSEDSVLFVDLRDFESVVHLRTSVFGGHQMAAWRDGSGRLTLIFDSLDEGLLATPQLADGLARELADFARDPALARRLRVRIACRTAVWVDSAESKLRAAWGDEQVLTRVLAPLRRVDVVAALQLAGVADPEAGLTELLHRGAGALAARPVTLNFLIGALRDGTVPDSQVALYLQGCLRLADESNARRVQRRTEGKCSARERLAVAARAAALTVFGNRTDLRLGPVPALTGVTRHSAELDVSEMLGGGEPVRPADDAKAGETRVDVSREAVRETLDTALFRASAAERTMAETHSFDHITRLTWAHWSFAEYLAARWVYINGLTGTQQDQLFFTRTSEGPRVVPQLRQTAAWLAGHDAEFLRRVIRDDPEVVLGSDIAVADTADRARLVATLLELARSDELQDLYRPSAELRALAHRGLADQLLPIIVDPAAAVRVREFALRIGTAAGNTEIAGVAIDLALDESTPIGVREEAIQMVGRVGAPSAKARLRQLLLGKPGAYTTDAGSATVDFDPHDELRGEVLRALWPEQLSADELFAALTPQKRNNFLGNYALFLQQFATQVDKGGLDDGVLDVALRWCETESVGDYHRHFEARARVAAAVVHATWRRLGSMPRQPSPPTTVVARLAAVSARRMLQHEPLVDNTGVDDLVSALGDEGQRRGFVVALIRELARAIRSATGEDAPAQADYLGMTLVRQGTVRGEDAEWLVTELRGATDAGDGDAAAIIIAVLVYLAGWAQEAAFDIVYRAAYGVDTPSLRGALPRNATVPNDRHRASGEDVAIVTEITVGGAPSGAENVNPGTIRATLHTLPDLARALDPYVKAVLLDSPEAQRARYSHEQMAGFETEHRAHADKDDERAAAIKHHVHQSANTVLAGDIDEWWRLNHWLCWSEDGAVIEPDPSLVGRPLWATLDDATRAGLVRAAAQYIHERDDAHAAWQQADRPSPPAMAGFRALRLLQDLDHGTYARLPHAVWRRWAAVVVAFPMYGVGARRDWYADLLSRAYIAAPDVVAAAVDRVAAIQDALYGTPFIMNQVDTLWSASDGGAALATALMAHLHRGLASGGNIPTRSGLASMLSTLLAHDVPDARALAEALVRGAPDDGVWAPTTAPNAESAAHAADAFAPTSIPPERATLHASPASEQPSSQDGSDSGTLDAEGEFNAGIARSPRERALAAAEALVRSASDAGWSIVWPLIASDREFATSLLLNCAGLRTGARGSVAGRLDAAAVAALYVRMVELFPIRERDDDDDDDGGRWVTPHDDAEQWRDALLQHLAGLGTAVALDALREIRVRFPERAGLVRLERAAEIALRRTAWAPATPTELLVLARGGRYRIVKTERDLADAVVASLSRFADEVRGPNATVEHFWNESADTEESKTSRWRPKDEETLSNALAAHLKRDLGPDGFTTVREVRLRPALGDRPAEDIDIYVDATVEESDGRRRTVTVLVEVKGQWFPRLADAIQTQLVERYLAQNPATSTGVFVVGWYLCPEWDPTHYQQRQAVTNGTDLMTFTVGLDAKAASLSTDGRDVRAVVIDVSLSTPSVGGRRSAKAKKTNRKASTSVPAVEAFVQTESAKGTPDTPDATDGAP